MKAVIQCSGSKTNSAGTFRLLGKRVKFVARPELAELNSEEEYFRPDDLIPLESETWRDHLVRYNKAGTNPVDLLPAGQLYSDPRYAQLLTALGPENLFILSAGWGLVRADYLLPDYDITFTQSARRLYRRSFTEDLFKDFNQLSAECLLPDETVYFFGGKEYVPFYHYLTKDLDARKVIYVASPTTDRLRGYGYEYIPFGKPFTKWQYTCAARFLANRLPK